MILKRISNDIPLQIKQNENGQPNSYAPVTSVFPKTANMYDVTPTINSFQQPKSNCQLINVKLHNGAEINILQN